MVHSGSESGTSCNTPSGFDPTDPEVITDLMTQPPMVDPRSPMASTIRFNEQVMVTEHAPSGSPRSGVASALTGNLGGGTASPSLSLPGSDALHQHANTGGSPSANGSPNSNDSRDSNGSNGNNGNQGGTSDGNDPRGSGPSGTNLNKLAFTYSATGGPLQHWGIKGMIRVAEVVRITGASIPQLHSVRHLMRPDTVDRVTNKMHFVHQHNDKNPVRAIINGMSLFVLKAPNSRMMPGNVTMLEDHVASSQQVRRMLSRHLAHANTSPRDRLPLEAPLLFYAERMQTHPCVIVGSFNCVKKVNDANVVVIPHGHDANGAPIVDPAVTQTPVILPALTASPAPGSAPSNAPPSGVAQDLVQGALAAMQVMTQVHAQSDLPNASMTQQQARLQAATMGSNVQQLKHLTSHLGNLGHEVGKAIASHPTKHSHAIQATLSHPNAVPGQSTDPQDLGSPTRAIPVSMSFLTCDYGPSYKLFNRSQTTRTHDAPTRQLIKLSNDTYPQR